MRETEIASLIPDGLTNPMIAKKLNINAQTVNTHRKNIFRKPGVHNIASLIKVLMTTYPGVQLKTGDRKNKVDNL